MLQNNSQHVEVENKLSELLRERTGYEIADLDRDATFLELGFDSLFLIQFSMELQKRFGVKISFRQLIEEVSTVDLLIEQLNAQVAPADVTTPAPSPAPSSSDTASTATALQSTPQQPAETPAPIAPTAPAPAPTAGSYAQPPAPTPQPIQPPPAPAPQPMQAAPQPMPAPTNLGNLDAVEQIIIQQNQLMAKHLELLMGQPAAGPAAAPLPASPNPTNIPSTTHDAVASSMDAACSSLGSCETTAPVPAKPKKENKHKRFGPYKPIRKGLNNGLTDRQSQHLSKFMEQYIARTANSRSHAETHRDYFADPRGVSSYRRIWKSMVYQIAVEKSKGSQLWDIDGNQYVDIAMGFGLNLFGQSPDFITKALHDQLDRGVEVGPQSPIAGEVAQLLCDFSRKDRATFCNTGSEAVMAAMRLARTVTGKSKVVYFNKDYHGNFDQVLVRSTRIGNKSISSPAAPGVPQSNAETMIVLDYGTPEALQTIRERADEIAAVLIEPVQSANPFLQPKEFLHEIRKITNENNMAMIMDEVITGFRVAQGGSQEYFDVWGDMSTYGKILGGGMPIGALAGSAKYMDALDGGTWRFDDQSEPEADMTFFAGTFVRHPLGLAAAHQVLMRLKEDGPELQKRLTARTTHLVDTLNAFFERELFPIRVAQFASQFRFMFPPDLEYADMLYFYMIHRGVFTRGWGDNCFLSTAHTDADIEHVIKVVQESCLDIRRGGFFPDAEDGSGENADSEKKNDLTASVASSSANSLQTTSSNALASGSSYADKPKSFSAPEFSTLAEIQPHGDRTPIFCAPAADGFTRVYHQLSDHLGENQPLYGLDSPGIYGMDMPGTLEEMAAGFVQEIRAVQPYGPYLLIGYCSGGTVAFEIAQQLIAAGEEVAFLGLIETYNWLDAPSTNPSRMTKLGYELQRVEFHIRNFLLLNFADKKKFLASKFEAVKNRTKVWRGLIGSKLSFGSKPAKKRTMSATNVNMADIWRVHDDLAEAYVPKPYPGRLVHFRPQRDYKCHLGTEYSARDGVEYHRLRAYPAGVMVNPFVGDLAEKLREAIDQRLGSPAHEASTPQQLMATQSI